MKRRNIPNARALRVNQTDAEKRLWAYLRNRAFFGFKFRRQMPVGPYIADFLCAERRLIIEIDGGQHSGSLRDAQRTAWLEGECYRVIRFWNNDVLANTEDVLTEIHAALGAPPHPTLSPEGRGL